MHNTLRRGRWPLVGCLFGLPLALSICCVAALWFVWPPLQLLRVGTSLPTYPRVLDAPYRTNLADYITDSEYVIAFNTDDSIQQVRQFYQVQQVPPCYMLFVSSQSSWHRPAPAITARAELVKRPIC